MAGPNTATIEKALTDLGFKATSTGIPGGGIDFTISDADLAKLKGKKIHLSDGDELTIE